MPSGTTKIDVSVINNLMSGIETVTQVSGVVTVDSDKPVAMFGVGIGAGTSPVDINTLAGGKDGQILIFRTTGSSGDIIWKDAVDNLSISGDFTHTRPDDTMTFIVDGSVYREISESDNRA